MCSRECLALHVDKNITGESVATVLDQVRQTRNLPQRIKVDNGPEFISKALDAWAILIMCSWNTQGRVRQQITPT
jgi:putative transposase